MSGFSVDAKRVGVTAHGPYEKVRWAVEVIRRWKDYTARNVPMKEAVYPAPPPERQTWMKGKGEKKGGS
jgi:hypothetical protein